MLPLDSPFFLTDKVANDVQKQFQWYLKTTCDATALGLVHHGSFPPLFSLADPGPLPSLDLSAELVVDCELLASRAAKAYLNQVSSVLEFNEKLEPLSSKHLNSHIEGMGCSEIWFCTIKETIRTEWSWWAETEYTLSSGWWVQRSAYQWTDHCGWPTWEDSGVVHSRCLVKQ